MEITKNIITKMKETAKNKDFIRSCIQLRKREYNSLKQTSKEAKNIKNIEFKPTKYPSDLTDAQWGNDRRIFSARTK